jgi:hypothetical protein
MRELLAVVLVVFSAGCGGVHTEEGAIESGLLGVYTIDTYRVSLEDCDDGVPDVAPPPASRIVLYGYSEEGSDEIRLAGSFCTSVEACRDVAHAGLTPLMGYSFAREGGGGSIGFDFPGGAPYNGEAFGLVQEHMLIRTAGGIRAETRTLQSGRYCVELLVLEGTFEAGL